MHKVFVYGTLKQGHGNHQRLLTNSTLVNMGSIEGFDLYDLGCYPAIVPHKEVPLTDKVFGELYEVDDLTLTKLDGLEGYRGGYNGFYDRKTVQVTTVDGDVEDALVYFMRSKPNDNVSVILEGVW